MRQLHAIDRRQAANDSGDPGAGSALLWATSRLLAGTNQAIMLLGMLALLVAAAVLTYSVLSREVFGMASDWEDEAAVFCLVGATFMCSAFVQSYRGHIGIEAIAGLMPPWAERIRLIVVDLISLAFCAFFAWKSWTLLHEAWVDGQTTSSSWAPPLWIPYLLMAVGMTLLSLQVALQLALGQRKDC